MPSTYCPSCGQRAVKPKDLTLGHALHHLVHETLHLDGRLWSTLKLLFLRPGQLSLDFAEGRRQRHIHPVRLLLVIAGLYFLVANPTVMNLQHIAGRDKSGRVAAQLERIARREGRSAAQVSETRSGRLQNRFKLAQLVWVGVSGGLLALLFRRRCREIGQHLAVASHNASWGFAIFMPVGLLMALSPNPMAPLLGMHLAGAVYAFLAYRRVYGEGRLATFAKTALLSLLDLAFSFVAMGYAVFSALR
jgi:hypothetical protein